MLTRLLRLACGCSADAAVSGLLTILGALMLAPPSAAQTCVGDCDDDGSVTINEIVLGVSIALGAQPLEGCLAFDRNGNHTVDVDELVAAVGVAQNGCPASPTSTAASTATATPSIPSSTSTLVPTPTSTVTASFGPTAMPTAVCAPAVATPQPSSPCVPTPGMFVDCFETSGLRGGTFDVGENGAAVADVDGDGFPDVFFWNTSGGARLFRNRGHDMQFDPVADSALVWDGATTVVAAAFGDLDNDGKPDLVVAVDGTDAAYHCGEAPLNAVRVYHNLGQDQFEEVTDAWGFATVGTEPGDKPVRVGFSLVDLNLDGRLDLLEYGRGLALRPLAFLSQPDGTTWQEAGRDIFGDARGLTFTVLFTDANHDQLLDAFIVNDYEETAPSKYYQRVDRSLSYADRALAPIFGAVPHGSPMGAATADLDGDGELDLVVTDTGDQHAFSRGTDVADAWDVKQNPSRYGLPQNCWSVAVVDLENDGRPDLFFECAGFRIGWPDKAASFLLRNRGGTFEIASGLLPNEEGPTWDEGLAVADFDQDGRLDFLTGGEEHPPRLLWNQIPAAPALAIRLKGTHANAQGIGARVTVQSPGLPLQVRELFAGGTTWGSGDSQLLFGLGHAADAMVTVDWRPAGGTGVQTVILPPGTWMIEEQ
jgi:hypothetical protein